MSYAMLRNFLLINQILDLHAYALFMPHVYRCRCTRISLMNSWYRFFFKEAVWKPQHKDDLFMYSKLSLCTLYMDQLFNMEFHFESVFNLEFQFEWWFWENVCIYWHSSLYPVLYTTHVIDFFLKFWVAEVTKYNHKFLVLMLQSKCDIFKYFVKKSMQENLLYINELGYSKGLLKITIICIYRLHNSLDLSNKPFCHTKSLVPEMCWVSFKEIFLTALINFILLIFGMNELITILVSR